MVSRRRCGEALASSPAMVASPASAGGTTRVADSVNTPPTPTKDYRFRVKYDISFQATSDGAAHRIAAHAQAAQRSAVADALATTHTVAVLDFDLAEDTGGQEPRFLRRATTRRRLEHWRVWLMDDVVSGILAAFLLAQGMLHANGWYLGCGVLAFGWWLTDRITARVERALKRKRKP